MTLRYNFKDKIIDDIISIPKIKTLINNKDNIEDIRNILEKINKLLPEYEIKISDSGKMYKSDNSFNNNIKTFFKSYYISNALSIDGNLEVANILLSLYSKDKSKYRIGYDIHTGDTMELHLSQEMISSIYDAIDDRVTDTEDCKDYFSTFYSRVMGSVQQLVDVVNEAEIKSEKYSKAITDDVNAIVKKVNTYIGSQPFLELSKIITLDALELELKTSKIVKRMKLINDYLNLESTRCLPFKKKATNTNSLLHSIGTYQFTIGIDTDKDIKIYFRKEEEIEKSCYELIAYIKNIKELDIHEYERDLKNEMIIKEIIENVKEKFNIDISNIIINKSIDEIKNMEITYNLYI